MNEAGKILKALTEAQYQVYNKQEETEEGLTPENRQIYNSEDIRNMFMGTLLTGNFKGDKLWGSLREVINKMPDEWVVEFLKVVNGDTIEKVSENVNESIYEPGTELLQFNNNLYYLYKSLLPGINQLLNKQDIDLQENPKSEKAIKEFYKTQIKELLDKLIDAINRLNDLFKEIYGE